MSPLATTDDRRHAQSLHRQRARYRWDRLIGHPLYPPPDTCDVCGLSVHPSQPVSVVERDQQRPLWVHSGCRGKR